MYNPILANKYICISHVKETIADLTPVVEDAGSKDFFFVSISFLYQ